MVIGRVSSPKSDPAKTGTHNGAILIVEDDADTADHLAERAKQFFQASVAVAGSLSQANLALDRLTPRIVLLDMLLPDGDGTELLLRLQRDEVPAIAVITAAPSLYRATLALRTRAADFLVKPFTQEQLTATFERLACRLAQEDERRRIRQEAQAGGQANDQLRMKIDILCRDLVGGYQKLVTRMTRPSE